MEKDLWVDHKLKKCVYVGKYQFKKGSPSVPTLNVNLIHDPTITLPLYSIVYNKSLTIFPFGMCKYGSSFCSPFGNRVKQIFPIFYFASLNVAKIALANDFMNMLINATHIFIENLLTAIINLNISDKFILMSLSKQNIQFHN